MIYGMKLEFLKSDSLLEDGILAPTISLAISNTEQIWKQYFKNNLQEEINVGGAFNHHCNCIITICTYSISFLNFSNDFRSRIFMV